VKPSFLAIPHYLGADESDEKCNDRQP
jgi:hypothetical protein